MYTWSTPHGQKRPKKKKEKNEKGGGCAKPGLRGPCGMDDAMVINIVRLDLLEELEASLGVARTTEGATINHSMLIKLTAK